MLLKAGTGLVDENKLVCFHPEHSVHGSAVAEGCGKQSFEGVFLCVLRVFAVFASLRFLALYFEVYVFLF